ncbi:histidine phosphatase family protein [Pseudomonas sp. NPDC089406]|uniref:lipopolysaccharide core heptose(II)-phosphate phosphatase PmrG n=1 Tax=Pseudomonas sp. NPDC089406 TaxID=3364463 RepID=UPI00384DD3BC
MLQGTLTTTPYPTRRLPRPKTLFIALAAMLLATATTTLWYSARPQITDLGSPRQMTRSGAYADWAKGSVIVLVRHAERCDRSHATCLGDPTGITVDGSLAAIGVGQGLVQLGLQGSDILASPEVRTRQTASFMFGKAIPSQDWLARCDATFASTALAHKRAGHNLVLVTHSGCIDHLERQFGVAGNERSIGYASALLLGEGSDGKAHILGRLNASQWRQLSHAKEA